MHELLDGVQLVQAGSHCIRGGGVATHIAGPKLQQEQEWYHVPPPPWHLGVVALRGQRCWGKK